MSVEDLEDYIEGYSNVFDENDMVNVTIGIDKIHGFRSVSKKACPLSRNSLDKSYGFRSVSNNA